MDNYNNQKNQDDVFHKYGRIVNEDVAKNKIDPVIGRNEEIRKVIEVLARKTKNNVVLLGEPGVGKTAIIEGLAQRIEKDDVPTSLKKKKIFEAYEDIKNPELTVTCDGEISNKDLIILSIATSIDALAIGISYAFLNVNIASLCLSIGIITFIICFLGVMIGKFLGPIFKNYSQIIGGIILILIGITILNEHTNFIYRMLH